MRKRLTVEANRQDKMHARCYVQEETDGHQPQPSRSPDEEEQRGGGNHSRQGQEQVEPQRTSQKGPFLLRGQGDQVPQGEGSKQERLHRQADHAIDLCQFSQQSVKAKRAPNDQCQPRELALMGRQVRHSSQSKQNTDALPEAQTFPQKQKTEQDTDQWSDEIAQTRLEDFTSLDGIEKSQPIGRDKQRRSAQCQQRRPITHGTPDIAQLATDTDKNEEEDCRPDNPVADNLQRGSTCQSLEKNGEGSPDEISRHTEQNPLTRAVRR